MIKPLERFVEHGLFQWSITGVIVLAAVVIGFETYPGVVEEYGSILHTIDNIILGIFIVEIVLRMIAYGQKFPAFFLDGWNLFDFSLVTINVVALIIGLDGQMVVILRLIRLLRVVRLIRVLPKLRLLVSALLRSLPSMLYVAILLVMIFYIYAVAGVFLFGSNDPGQFGDLQSSLLSLFRIVTLEDWTDIMYTQMYGCEAYPSQIPSECTQPMAMPVLGAGYFVSFVLFGTMIILNLVIGVIINAMQEATDAEDRRQAALEAAELTAGHSSHDQLAQLQRDLEEIAKRISHIQHVQEAEIQQSQPQDSPRA